MWLFLRLSRDYCESLSILVLTWWTVFGYRYYVHINADTMHGDTGIRPYRYGGTCTSIHTDVYSECLDPWTLMDTHPDIPQYYVCHIIGFLLLYNLSFLQHVSVIVPVHVLRDKSTKVVTKVVKLSIGQINK